MIAINPNLAKFDPAFNPRAVSPATHRLRLNPHPAPLSTVEPSEHTQQRMGEWITCPGCTKVYCAGQIVTSEPEPVEDYMSAHYTGLVVKRRLYCDHQNWIIVWRQAVDRHGKLGAEIGPWYPEKDQSVIDKFLREHPEARGVAQ